MKKYLKTVVYLLIYIAAYAVIIYPVVFGLKYLAEIYAPFKAWLIPNRLFAIILNDAIAIALFIPLIRFFKRKSFVEHCRLKPLKAPTLVGILLLGIATGFITVCVFRITSVSSRYPELEAALSVLLDNGTPLIFLTFLLLNSFYKEVLFRGMILNELLETTHLYIALIVQAVIYGVVFLQTTYLLMIYAAFGGTLFAMLYLWYRSMWASVAAQVGSTGGLYIARNMLDISPSTDGFSIVFAVSAIATAVGIYILWRNKELLRAKSDDEAISASFNS